MKSNEAVVVVCSRFEGSRRDDRYRNSNTIVKALTRRFSRIHCSMLMQRENEGNIGPKNLTSSRISLFSRIASAVLVNSASSSTCISILNRVRFSDGANAVRSRVSRVFYWRHLSLSLSLTLSDEDLRSDRCLEQKSQRNCPPYTPLLYTVLWLKTTFCEKLPCVRFIGENNGWLSNDRGLQPGTADGLTRYHARDAIQAWNYTRIPEASRRCKSACIYHLARSASTAAFSRSCKGLSRNFAIYSRCYFFQLKLQRYVNAETYYTYTTSSTYSAILLRNKWYHKRFA